MTNARRRLVPRLLEIENRRRAAQGLTLLSKPSYRSTREMKKAKRVQKAILPNQTRQVAQPNELFCRYPASSEDLPTSARFGTVCESDSSLNIPYNSLHWPMPFKSPLPDAISAAGCRSTSCGRVVQTVSTTDQLSWFPESAADQRAHATPDNWNVHNVFF